MSVSQITSKLAYEGGYVDNLLGPYEDINGLKGIATSYRFVGLTVTVLAPVQMECWLVEKTGNNYWRIKTILPLATHKDLEDVTAYIEANLIKMVNVGTEVTVITDETNDGKLTKYWASEVIATSAVKKVTWEKMGGADVTGYAKESWVEDNFVEKDCISGEDKE